MARLFILYDGRAHYDVDDASVLCTARSDGEAFNDAQMFGETVCYSYDVSESVLKDARYEWATNEHGKKLE